MAAFYTIDYLRARCEIDEKGCWIWQGAKAHGYGTVGPNQTGSTNTHKVMWILHHGTYSGDMRLDHLCRNRACCNPEHLEVITHLENCQRGIQRCAKITHCPQGHEYTPENTYHSGGRRTCKQCNTEKCRRYQERKRHSVLPVDVLSIFGKSE